MPNVFLLRAFEAAMFHFIDERQSVVGPDSVKEMYSQMFAHIEQYIDAKSPKIDYGGLFISDIVAICDDLRLAFPLFNDRIVEIKTFLHQLNTFIHKQHAEIYPGEVLTIGLKRAGIRSLQEFVEAFYKVDRIGTFAEFYFSHEPGKETSLSSGEYAMLSLFGRLNSIKLSPHTPALLLVDEAELALHPQWQKQFVSVFTNFVTERFKDHLVQVVLTSHSPFILSDLPPHCVILLKKDEGGPGIVDGLANHKETFGANIHELFTDSFFLQDGLMGEFARRKIEKLIQDINQEESTIAFEKYNSVYKRRVAIIGERFLKTKILELIASKADTETVDAIINLQSDELRILRDIRNQKENGQN